MYINLENRLVLAELDKNPVNLLAFLSSADERIIVLVDEVQYLNDPSHFLKLLFDEYAERLKIIATGSIAFYLNHKFRDSLAGRKRIFQLNTCDFDDYLSLRGRDDLRIELSRIIHEPNAKSLLVAEIRAEWEQYALYGGYPAVILEIDTSEKIEMLKELRDSFVKSDIEEAGVQNVQVFYQLFKILAVQTGQLVNTNELANTLKVRHETVSNYLSVMQRCFHLSLVSPFSGNIRKELTKMPKSYLLDTGLRNCIIHNFQPFALRIDRGELWEQMFFRSLIDRSPDQEIYFWRTADQHEVDFVLPNLALPLAIEVKYDERLVKQKKYGQFIKNYPHFHFQFACMEPFDENLLRLIFGPLSHINSPK